MNQFVVLINPPKRIDTLDPSVDLSMTRKFSDRHSQQVSQFEFSATDVTAKKHKADEKKEPVPIHWHPGMKSWVIASCTRKRSEKLPSWRMRKMKRILELNPRGELEEDANVVQMYGVLSSGDSFNAIR